MRMWLPAISTLALLCHSTAAAQETAPAASAADGAAEKTLDLVASTLVPCAGGGIAFALGTGIHYALLTSLHDLPLSPTSHFLSSAWSGGGFNTTDLAVATTGGTALVPVGVALAGLAWHRDFGSVVGAIANVLPTVFAIMVATTTTSRYLTGPTWHVFDWSTAPVVVAPIALALFVLTRHLANGSLALVLDGVAEPGRMTPLPEEQ